MARNIVVLAVVGVIAALNAVPRAEAVSTKVFASPVMRGALTAQLLISCQITNLGTKPVTIASVQILTLTDPITPIPADDTCTSGPLPPGKTCTFAGTVSGLGGGAAQIAGDTRKLRGFCTLHDPSTFVPKGVGAEMKSRSD